MYIKTDEETAFTACINLKTGRVHFYKYYLLRRCIWTKWYINGLSATTTSSTILFLLSANPGMTLWNKCDVLVRSLNLNYDMMWYKNVLFLRQFLHTLVCWVQHKVHMALSTIFATSDWGVPLYTKTQTFSAFPRPASAAGVLRGTQIGLFVFVPPSPKQTKINKLFTYVMMRVYTYILPAQIRFVFF